MDIHRVLRRSTEVPRAAARRTFIARVRAPPAVRVGHWDVGRLQLRAVVGDTPNDVCFQLAEGAHIFEYKDVARWRAKVARERG